MLLFFLLSTVLVTAAYEDFLTYVKVDEDPGDITVTTSRVTWNPLDLDDTSYVYKDFGAGHFGDFSHDIELQLGTTHADGKASGWVLANEIAEYDYLYDNNKEALLIVMIAPSNNYRMQFKVGSYE